MAGGTYLVKENPSLRSRLESLSAQQRDLEYRTHELQQQLRQAQRRSESAGHKVENGAATGRAELPSSHRCFWWQAPPARKRVSINSCSIAGLRSHRLKYSLSPGTTIRVFALISVARGGRKILTLADVPRRGRAGGYIVSMDLAASPLSTAGYEIALKDCATASLRGKSATTTSVL
jgi:hypothetical protein